MKDYKRIQRQKIVTKLNKEYITYIGDKSKRNPFYFDFFKNPVTEKKGPWEGEDVKSFVPSLKQYMELKGYKEDGRKIKTKSDPDAEKGSGNAKEAHADALKKAIMDRQQGELRALRKVYVDLSEDEFKRRGLGKYTNPYDALNYIKDIQLRRKEEEKRRKREEEMRKREEKQSGGLRALLRSTLERVRKDVG